MKTPPNVRMIATSQAELAWLLAGVVYPADADGQPHVYVNDFKEASAGKLTERQMKPRNVRAVAARFIQKLLSKVCNENAMLCRTAPSYCCVVGLERSALTAVVCWDVLEMALFRVRCCCGWCFCLP